MIAKDAADSVTPSGSFTHFINLQSIISGLVEASAIPTESLCPLLPDYIRNYVAVYTHTEHAYILLDSAVG